MHAALNSPLVGRDGRKSWEGISAASTADQ